MATHLHAFVSQTLPENLNAPAVSHQVVMIQNGKGQREQECDLCVFPSSISQHSHSSYHQSKHISEQPEGKVSKSGHRCCYLKFYSVLFINALKQKTDGAGLLPYYLFSWHLIEGRVN